MLRLKSLVHQVLTCERALEVRFLVRWFHGVLLFQLTDLFQDSANVLEASLGGSATELEIGSPTDIGDEKIIAASSSSTATASPGWIQGFLTKVLSNVAVEISHLSVVYREEDVAFTLHFDSINVFSCDSRWEKAYCVRLAVFVLGALITTSGFTRSIQITSQNCNDLKL